MNRCWSRTSPRTLRRYSTLPERSVPLGGRPRRWPASAVRQQARCMRRYRTKNRNGMGGSTSARAIHADRETFQDSSDAFVRPAPLRSAPHAMPWTSRNHGRCCQTAARSRLRTPNGAPPTVGSHRGKVGAAQSRVRTPPASTRRVTRFLVLTSVNVPRACRMVRSSSPFGRQASQDGASWRAELSPEEAHPRILARTAGVPRQNTGALEPGRLGKRTLAQHCRCVPAHVARYRLLPAYSFVFCCHKMGLNSGHTWIAQAYSSNRKESVSKANMTWG